MSLWTIKKLLTWSESYFQDHGIDAPRLTAEILLAHLLKMRRLDLYLQHDRPLEADELSAFKLLIKRRRAREPVAYITGEKGFFNDTFKVSKGVLIPRPDTEVLVETAIDWLNSGRFGNGQDRDGAAWVAELGVGSGAIIVSLASACPGHVFMGCDISGLALSVARENARALCQDAVCFFQGSWLSAISADARFDLILSNPPYIPSADIRELEPEVREYEPGLALDGGEDGLAAVREILDQAGERLNPGGRLMLEIGFDQKGSVAALEDCYGWIESLVFKRDLAGHYRVAVFEKIN